MRRTLLLVALALVVAMPAAIAEEQAAVDEKALIEKAIRNYIDGWYEGSAERMESALHPDLTKRRVVALPSGGEILNTVSADTMIAYAGMGVGLKSKREGQVNEVIILDVSPQTAAAKSVSHEYIDYLHLAKVNGEWRIVNVLWEVNKP